MKPNADEYAPYYSKYVVPLPDGDICSLLESQMRDTIEMLNGIDEEQASYKYAPNKWSVKEVMGHVIDGERIFTYRALAFARRDNVSVPGFDQDEYVANGAFSDRTMKDIVAEYEAVRRSTVAFFSSLRPDDWLRRGIANGMDVSVRGLAWIIAGHELHHANVLKSKYLLTVSTDDR